MPDPGRRRVLKWTGAAFVAGLAGLLFSGVRFLIPNSPSRQKHRYRLDKAISYPADAADARHRKALGLYIVRTGKQCVALNANCTHLGCSIEWMRGEALFKCPCHGSGFSLEGVNLEGPAPRALERYWIETDGDGRLIVDLSVKFLREQGGWENPLSRAVL